ncbi:hypothetical protein [Leifsonia poae]|uniref:hypothetical protein n=1 Tax=Leifsonia poae TaxID=110933 RepID=UPI003D667D6E
MSTEPDERGTVTESSVRVKRSPRYARFMLAGFLVFAVVALILTFAFPENPTYDRGAVFGFLLLFFGVVGVAIGAVVALLVDRSGTRKARTVLADRVTVSAEPEERVTRAETPGIEDAPDTHKSIEN